MTAATWKRLERRDLRTFDDDATKMVLAAMNVDEKSEGRISAKGHAIIRAGTGATLAIPPKLSLANRSAQNCAADFKRVFGTAYTDVVAPRPSDSDGNGTSGALALASPIPHDAEPSLECPASKCDKVFVTEGARYSHIDKNHAKCGECGKVCMDPFGLMVHQRSAHDPEGKEQHKAWSSQGGKRARANARDRKGRQSVPEVPDMAEGMKKVGQAVNAALTTVARPKAPRKHVNHDKAAEVILKQIAQLLPEEVLSVKSDPRVEELELKLVRAEARIRLLESQLAAIRKAFETEGGE